MYNLSLFGIFPEGTLLNLTETFCTSLTRVLNDKLSSYLISFIDEFDASPIPNETDSISVALTERIQLLKTLTLPRAKVLTLHIYLREKAFRDTSLFDFIKTLSLERVNPLTWTPNELEEIGACLTEIVGLMPIMVERIEARQKKDFEAFLGEVVQVDFLTQRMAASFPPGVIKFEMDCAGICRDNSELFYTYREPPRQTGLYSIINKESEYLTILKGIHYVQRCDRDRISMHERALI